MFAEAPRLADGRSALLLWSVHHLRPPAGRQPQGLAPSRNVAKTGYERAVRLVQRFFRLTLEPGCGPKAQAVPSFLRVVRDRSGRGDNRTRQQHRNVKPTHIALKQA